MKRLTGSGKAKSGKLIHDNTEQVINFLNANNGKTVYYSLTINKPKRSDVQNNYYWKVLIGILSDWTGYEEEEVHAFLRAKFLTDKSKKIPRIRSTTSLDTAEFEEYIERIKRWAAQHGVYIPDPT